MTAIPSSMVRRLLYDVSMDGCASCALMGMPDASADVRAKEHDASDARLERLHPLHGVLEALSRELAKLSVEMHIYAATQVQGELEVDEFSKQQAIEQNKELILGPTQSILSVMIDEGMLCFPDKEK